MIKSSEENEFNHDVMKLYGIDRIGLNKAGVGEDEIEIFYRSLYLTTRQYYDKLNNLLASVTLDKGSLFTKIWKAF